MTDKPKLEEVTYQTDPIFEGKIIKLQVEHVRLPDGRTAVREVVKHPGAVAVLALKAGKMIVVEQYRKAMGRTLVEIPAGKLESGEDPLESAKRELAEETGFTAEAWRPVSSFYTSPGFADEIIHLYLAEQLTAGDARPDDDEFLACFSVEPKEADRLIAEGKIRDAKTIAAVYAWKIYRLTGECP